MELQGKELERGMRSPLAVGTHGTWGGFPSRMMRQVVRTSGIQSQNICVPSGGSLGGLSASNDEENADSLHSWHRGSFLA